MARNVGYLLILESGAGGYIAGTDESDACDRASHTDGQRWVLRCKFDEHTSGRHRRGRPLVKLRIISTLGRPSAMPAALAAAGERHYVEYVLD